MKRKRGVSFGSIGTVAGVLIVVGFLAYAFSRRDAIKNRVFGALDSGLGGSGGSGGNAGPTEELPPGADHVDRAFPLGGAARRQPNNSLLRIINYYRQQPTAPTQSQQRADTVQSFQNAYPNLRARYSGSGNRLIVTDPRGTQYATSTTPNQVTDFYNSIRNQPPGASLGVNGQNRQAVTPTPVRAPGTRQQQQNALDRYRAALAGSGGSPSTFRTYRN